MATAKVTKNRLAEEGVEYREKNIPGKNRYSQEINEYSGENEDALSHDDEQHPWGKGTGKSMGYAVRNLSAPKTQMNYSNVDTRNGGGSYDKFGTKGIDKAFQGDSGRQFLQKLNEYSHENEYGKNSVDIDTKVKGQFVN